jgi:hypothetical protein
MEFLLLAHNEKDINLLKQAVLFRLLGTPCRSSSTCVLAIEHAVICQTMGDTRRWFKSLAGLLGRALDRGRITVLVSGIRPFSLNPLVDSGSESVLAMLILAFPDVRWMFGTIKGYGGADKGKKLELNAFRSAHGIANLFRPDQSALFDGTGLRDWVRQRATVDDQTKDDASYLPRRTRLAVSLDDETAYSYLHAYTAYRFGFRATTLDSAALCDDLLARNSTSSAPFLAFEDVYVNFVDGSSGMSWLDANPKDGVGRTKRWPRLEFAPFRIFVTSGQRFPGDELKWQLNNAYIAQQIAKPTHDGRPRHVKKLYKPYAGMFRLWEESGLTRKLRLAPEFRWPPPKNSFFASEHGHSSPGALLAIAEKLVERAEGLLSEIRSVQQAVRGAVLATDAFEILGGRTPTAAIDALQLKHHFEVVAECQFVGVEHHIRLEERFAEIERDVRIVSRWFGPERQEVAALNAQIAILTDLVRVFRESAQFDEEQDCLQRVRKLHRRLWFRGHKFWLTPIYPFRWYVEFLLGSIPRLVSAIGLWILLLALLYVWTSNCRFSTALHAAFISFVAIQPDGNDPNKVVTALAMLSGVTHLGIFISHLYSLVARK